MSTQNGANWKISKTKQNKQNKQTIPPPPHPKKPLTNSHNRSQNMHKKLQIKMETTHLFQHLRQKKHIPSSTTRLWKYQQLMTCNPNVNKLLAAGGLASYTPYEREQTADKNY